MPTVCWVLGIQGTIMLGAYPQEPVRQHKTSERIILWLLHWNLYQIICHLIIEGYLCCSLLWECSSHLPKWIAGSLTAVASFTFYCSLHGVEWTQPLPACRLAGSEPEDSHPNSSLLYPLISCHSHRFHPTRSQRARQPAHAMSWERWIWRGKRRLSSDSVHRSS